MNPFFFTALIGLKLGLFLFFYILQRIVSENTFVRLEMPKNISFIEIPEKLGTTNWVVTSSKTDLIVLNTNISFFSCGEQITIVKVDEHSILVNSRPKGQQPFTFGKERYNFNKIKSLLN